MNNMSNTERDNPLKKIALQCANFDSFAIACHKISDIAILDQKSKFLDLNVVRIHLANEGRLTLKQLEKILRDGEYFLKAEPNLIEINKKCHIFGDFHGQFYDLISILDSFNLETDTILFLGDYVDRGLFSVETYLYLILLKTHYPNNVYLLRGNHETERMTRYFTFKAECNYKYGSVAYELFLNSFNALPVAAVVQSMAFCAHAGISPDLNNLKKINSFNRFKEMEYTGLLCDIVWSDPHEFYDLGLGRSWEYNDKRRCSFKYNYEDVKRFLNKTGLSMVIRAHEVQEQGYSLLKMYNKHHSVVTIFSAPCYCDSYQNKGAYIQFDMGIVSIKQFEAVPHPFVISSFVDGINWSLPFVAEKVVQFAVALFKELESGFVLEEPEEFVANMNIMREEREAIDEFEKDESLDSCALSITDNEFEDFDKSKEKDKENEKIKDGGLESNISIKVSPSLQPNAISKNKIPSTDYKRKPDETSKQSKKKKGMCQWLCGLF